MGYLPWEGEAVRGSLWRCSVMVPVLAIAAGAAAQPAPRAFPAEKAKADPEDTSAQRAKLQAEFLSLLKALGDRGPVTPGPMPPPVPPKGKYDYPPTDLGSRVDVIAEGMNLFRDGNFEAARRTFFGADPATLAPPDRLFARYMLACSLRRLNKVADAEVIYREVANSTGDEFLANCAIWQLSLIGANKELEAQLEQLRSRAKSR